MRRAKLADWLATRWRGMQAPTLFVISFLVLVGVGTLGLLVLPGLYTGPRLSLLDALFTATSATCVTGLIVVDTASHFTFWGQLWLLVLFQLGGLGLITMTSLVIGAIGRRLTLRTEMIAAPWMREHHGRELVNLTGSIIKFTLVTEVAFALVLWLQWTPDFGARSAAWHALFHAVSAFCNAGFSTFSDSLVGFAARPGILLPASVVIIIGGFGYLSGLELVRWWRANGLRGSARLSTHTYAALAVTIILLVSGAITFTILEWNGVLGELSVIDRLVNGWFMSTTARTAGFNSVPYQLIGNNTAYVTILLMAVGGSPGSTAGGIKTTALAILAAMAWSRVRGRRHVQLHDRTIPEGTVGRAISLTVLFFVMVTAVNFLLSFSETATTDLASARQSFLPLMFEAASAAGTVGLSMGVTATLTDLGKVLIIVSMFMGRVGPLAFFAAISIKSRGVAGRYRTAHEDMIVG
jgi:trk system potassium uptake protein TrkH